MKPNFTLFLSAGGLRLLHSNGSGWQLVGMVPLNSDDLDGELAFLQRTAAALEPGGIRCRLILPEDQIRYDSIAASDLDQREMHAAAEAALEGVTPYAVTDLAYDVYREDGVCYIAAVAKETLAEAEQFALSHGLKPMCVGGLRRDTDVRWEPDFGTTEYWAQQATAPKERAEPFHEAATNTITAPAETQITEAAPADIQPTFASRRVRRAMDQSVSADHSPTPASSAPPPRHNIKGFAEPSVEFIGRKKNPSAPKRGAEPPQKATPAPMPRARPNASEEDRLTVFGARGDQQAGPRTGRSGKMLVATAVLGVIGIAGWAMITPPTDVVSALLSEQPVEEVAPRPQFTSPIDPIPAPTQAIVSPTTIAPKVLPTRATLTDEDSAVLDALGGPLLAEPDVTKQLTPQAARTQYAVTGIWALAPSVPDAPEAIDIQDLYITSIDPINITLDAIALPEVAAQLTDTSLPLPSAPAPAGTRFSLDERGLVAPSAQGTLNPDGIAVFSGPPPARPPERATVPVTQTEDPRFVGLAAFRPQSRPTDLIENTERATFDGLTRAELAEYRPQLRPQSAQQQALSSASLVPGDGTPNQAALAANGSLVTGTPQATARSLRPDARPSNFGKIVENSRSIASTANTNRSESVVRTASVAPRAVVPKIPSSASATREATIQNAINMRKVNLIGVYGKPSDRRALVRLSNGRYKKVQVGDRIDGGRISAIGDTELRYQKSGRNLVLKMPRS
ncbi:MAG: hypothetical protein AB8B58_11950 [Roseobacter sp.]